MNCYETSTLSITQESVGQSQQERHWQQLTTEFQQITDALGNPIDTGIIGIVVALNAHGVNTVQSCEGHIEKGVAAPWVEIAAKETSELIDLWDQAQQIFEEAEECERKQASDEEVAALYAKYHQLAKEAMRPDLEEAERAMGLLTAFYQNRTVSYDNRLIIIPSGKHFRIQSQGALTQIILSSEKQQQKLYEYQNEMEIFASFLKKRYFYIEPL